MHPKEGLAAGTGAGVSIKDRKIFRDPDQSQQVRIWKAGAHRLPVSLLDSTFRVPTKLRKWARSPVDQT